jgi:hypothetical protein
MTSLNGNLTVINIEGTAILNRRTFFVLMPNNRVTKSGISSTIPDTVLMLGI